MKRNWFLIAVILLITVGMWAQVATSAAKTTDKAAAGCACCNHDMKDMKADTKGHDHAAMHGAAMSGCCGKDAKDGMACSRKDGKSCCAGMKKDAKATTSASNDKQSCCGKDCKDCCKDGKCEMAKNGKKCCANCPGMAEGK